MIIYVVFYSEHGHVYKLAKAVAEGARSVGGASVELFQVIDIYRESEHEQHEIRESRKQFAHIPYITGTELARADAVIFGTPSRFGIMAPQMRNLLFEMEPLWVDGAMIGKVGSVFTTAAVNQGGQESTLTGFHVALLHLGMIIVGVPYCEKRLLPLEPISGRNPYGASAIVGTDRIFPLNETEIGIARFQGQHVAEVCKFLVRGKERAEER
jgi:NAD(P)H dehydrogenase (quinone)